jgi:hypothetical protein
MCESAPEETTKVKITTIEELQSLLWQQVTASMIEDLQPRPGQSGIIETTDE